MSIYSIPCLKPMVEFCSIDNKLYLFNNAGIGIEIDDANNFITTVCKTMDGNKDIHQLKKILGGTFPKETEFLEDLLAVLDKENLLEDKQKNYPSQLTEYDLDRWRCNIEFFGSYCNAVEINIHTKKS